MQPALCSKLWCTDSQPHSFRFSWLVLHSSRSMHRFLSALCKRGPMRLPSTILLRVPGRSKCTTCSPHKNSGVAPRCRLRSSLPRLRRMYQWRFAMCGVPTLFSCVITAVSGTGGDPRRRNQTASSSPFGRARRGRPSRMARLLYPWMTAIRPKRRSGLRAPT